MFPLHKKAHLTDDPLSFQTLDLRTHTEIPGRGHPGAFGAIRKHHIHEGVDLYALEGDEVFAMEAGVIVSLGAFTGPSAGTPWWLDTQFVMVQSASQVLCYGEISLASGLSVGASIEEGQLLGTIATVLRNDKGRPRNMLHMERYVSGVRASCGLWPLHTPCPLGLLDPTPILLRELQRAANA